MWDLQQPLPAAVKEGRGLPKSLCICRPLTDSGALFQENGRHSNYSLQEVYRPQTCRLQDRSALSVPRSTRLDMSSLPTPYSLGVKHSLSGVQAACPLLGLLFCAPLFLKPLRRGSHSASGPPPCSFHDINSQINSLPP